MNYTGLNTKGRQDYRVAYKINRPLEQSEIASQLDKKKKASTTPLDWFSVIKCNSTYLEIVDRWYGIRGSMVWLGASFMFISLLSLSILFYFTIKENEVGMWIGTGLFTPIWLLFLYFGYRVTRYDLFRGTHYPIRLNRKSHMVYVTRPGDSVLSVPWNELFVCPELTKEVMGKSWDLRALVLADDRETVIDTFSLGYPESGGRDEVIQIWEFIRRYMENEEGHKEAYENVKLCMPVDGRREGLLFGIIRVNAPNAKHPIAQFINSFAYALTIPGRWAAMYTSKIPVWPKEIEEACPIEADDPYAKDWRSNGKYGFGYLGWPLICFLFFESIFCYIIFGIIMKVLAQ